ncbi:MAG: hypothetical protein F6K47_04490 [Symploca sp. SIO2E6]|nr:hypothetical protein [Symploca sp. SIO2E6]
MLNFFNNLSSPVKVFLGFFLAGLIFAGLLSVDYLTSFITSSDTLVKVELLVQTEDNQPIQDAKIQFISRGSPTTKYTTVNGYAEIKIPFRESVEINITKEGYETFVDIINLEVDPDTNKKFKLKSLNSSSKTIDYQYYTSQNEFIPLILSSLRPDLNIPIIQQVLEHIHIDKIPLIARNDVFENIERFKVESNNQRTIQKAIDGKYGFEASDAEQIDSSSFFIPNETGVVEYSSTNKLSNRLGDNCYFSYAPLLGSFQTADDNIKYTALIQYDNADEYGNIIQYPKLLDLAKYGKKDYGRLNCSDNLGDVWIRKIINNNQDVRGFLGFDYHFIFDLQNHRLGCQDSWEITRIAPSPYLKFIDIINNNQEAIRIESINYESINKSPYQLTVADQRSVLFKSSSGFTKEINILLQPANHFLIPIEFGFNTQPVKEAYQLYADMEKSKLLKAEEIYVRKPLSKVESEKENKVTDLNQFNKINMSPVNISEDFINGANSLTDLFNSIPKRFAVGMILNVKSLKINGQTINIAPPSDEPTVYISTLLEGGSCPYLVVYDAQQKSWLELGTILSARKNKSLQQEELHHLGNNVSKIKIEEREPEITYIDALSIVYTEPNTEEVQAVVYPTPELQKVDEDYFLLHQGEALEIDLEKFVPPNAFDVMLKINGYYQALQTSLS